jgi:hypothetical protein
MIVDSTKSSLTGLADIAPPAAPPEVAWSGAAITITIVLLAIGLLVYYLRIRRSPQTQAQRRLNLLCRELNKNMVEPRKAVFNLAACVRFGLGLSKLISTTPLPYTARETDSAHQQRWLQFITTLSKLRYAASPPTRVEVNALFKEAKYWLRIRK